jgi:hypothetical protein
VNLFYMGIAIAIPLMILFSPWFFAPQPEPQPARRGVETSQVQP